MAREITQFQKDSAQASSDLAVPLSLVSGFLSVAIGGAFALVVPGVGFGIGVWYAAWSAGMGLHTHNMNGIVRDPPDPQFDTAVQLGQLAFDLDQLSADDDFSQLSRAALLELLETDRHAAAMVRAIERSQGAAMARQAVAEEARFEEAESYARELGRHLIQFATSARPVAEATLAQPALDWSQVRGGRLLDLLAPEVLSDLYLAGVARGYLDVPITENRSRIPALLCA